MLNSMKIAIDRQNIVVLMIKVLYEYPSINNISVGNDIVVDIKDYENLCHDLGILLGKVIEYSSSPYEQEE